MQGFLWTQSLAYLAHATRLWQGFADERDETESAGRIVEGRLRLCGARKDGGKVLSADGGAGHRVKEVSAKAREPAKIATVRILIAVLGELECCRVRLVAVGR